jgi:hypothetical protein
MRNAPNVRLESIGSNRRLQVYTRRLLQNYKQFQKRSQRQYRRSKTYGISGKERCGGRRAKVRFCLVEAVRKS